MEESNCVSVVEPENKTELATAIVKLLGDEQLRKQIGENGRLYAVNNMSWESVAKRVNNVCQDLVHSRIKADAR